MVRCIDSHDRGDGVVVQIRRRVLFRSIPWQSGAGQLYADRVRAFDDMECLKGRSVAGACDEYQEYPAGGDILYRIERGIYHDFLYRDRTGNHHEESVPEDRRT